MSEQHSSQQPEQHVRHEAAPTQPDRKERQEHAPKPAHETKHDHNVDKLKASIHQEAISSREVTIGEHRKDANQPVLGIQRELKAVAYKQTLHKIQTHMQPAEQAFSKLIHQPKIEAVSEVSAKTIGRPSGILGGGIAALLGGGFVLYISKHNGFRYNFFIFILLFFGGFIMGALLELVFKLVRRKQT